MGAEDAAAPPPPDRVLVYGRVKPQSAAVHAVGLHSRLNAVDT
jgi:hypothetical protein